MILSEDGQELLAVLGRLHTPIDFGDPSFLIYQVGHPLHPHVLPSERFLQAPGPVGLSDPVVLIGEEPKG